jgi:hypothetical protein
MHPHRRTAPARIVGYFGFLGTSRPSVFELLLRYPRFDPRSRRPEMDGPIVLRQAQRKSQAHGILWVSGTETKFRALNTAESDAATKHGVP